MNSIDFLIDDSRVTSTLGKAMTRRAIMKGLAGVGAAALAVATIGPALAHHTEQTYTVSASANFRSGPGTSYSKLGVINPGATFQINGQVQNGYAGIIYNGKSGWVLASLVVEAGAASPTPTPTTNDIVDTAWTQSDVRMRSGPGTSYTILRVVPWGTQIAITNTVKNGFRYVFYAGKGGWMADAYISAIDPHHPDGSPATTTSNVNLRAEPSTSAPIMQLIPAGSKIGILPTVPVNDFFNVTYNGKTGWVYSAYVQT